MTVLEQIRASIKAALTERAAKQADLDASLAAPSAEARDLNEQEAAAFTAARDALQAIDARTAELRARETELVEIESRRAAADALVAELNPEPPAAPTPVSTAVVSNVKEELTYRKAGQNSYIRDLVLANSPSHRDTQSQARLTRHSQEMAVELRANPNRTDGTGGEFVPPLWLMNEYVALARPARVTADLCRKLALPAGTDSINMPKVSTGTTVANQTADGAAASKTDMTTTSVVAPVLTIAGQQVFSLQLLEQSPINYDEVVFADLIADYAKKLDVQVINGSGGSGQSTGILGTSSIGAVTYTDGSPTVPELYLPLAQASNAVQVNRFLPASCFVMHPRRWNWLLSFLDTSNRPLIVPTVQGPYMAAGVGQETAAQGRVGSILGLDVYVDPGIPITLGGGTEDAVICGRFEDAYLWEGPMRTRTLFETDSNTLEVRLQVYAYVAFTAGRYPAAFAKITGTGLAQPSGF